MYDIHTQKQPHPHKHFLFQLLTQEIQSASNMYSQEEKKQQCNSFQIAREKSDRKKKTLKKPQYSKI